MALHLLSRQKKLLAYISLTLMDQTLLNNISGCSETQTILSQSIRVDHIVHFHLLLAV